MVVRPPSALAAVTRAAIGSAVGAPEAVLAPGVPVGAVVGAVLAPPPQAATTIARIAPPTMRRGIVWVVVNYSSSSVWVRDRVPRPSWQWLSPGASAMTW